MHGNYKAERWEVDPETGCWNWLLGLDHGGYGKTSVGRKSYSAHRWSYEVHVGPIPEGLVIDHLCRNRRCVNPEHLEPVTTAENNRRSVNPLGLRTHCKRGHEFSDENTRWDKSRNSVGWHRVCRECDRITRRARVAKRRAAEAVAR